MAEVEAQAMQYWLAAIQPLNISRIIRPVHRARDSLLWQLIVNELPTSDRRQIGNSLSKKIHLKACSPHYMKALEKKGKPKCISSSTSLRPGTVCELHNTWRQSLHLHWRPHVAARLMPSPHVHFLSVICLWKGSFISELPVPFKGR